MATRFGTVQVNNAATMDAAVRAAAVLGVSVINKHLCVKSLIDVQTHTMATKFGKMIVL